MPWAWFGAAHASLLAALAVVVFDPALFGGFYYHPRAIAVVHLVTLGWISCNIVGSLYVVGPIALRVRLAGGAAGALAFALVGVGIAGMVAHFWLDSYPGMAWAAGSTILGFLVIGARAVPAFLQGRVPPAARWHIALAFFNLLAAGVLGLLIGLEKIGALVLPGAVLPAVHAHAHLAAVGWGLMMVMGIGYRLLPMQLPAAIPPGSGSRASAWLLEAGLLAMVAGRLASRTEVAAAGALAILAGLGVFARHVAWMLRHRRRPPAGLPRPDLAILVTGHALLYLAVASVVGVLLLLLPDSETSIRLAFVYGVAGLLGFLGQIIVGVGARLLPMATWMQAFVEGGFTPPPTGLHEVPLRPLQWVTLGGWVAGLPALGAGLGVGVTPVIRIGAGLLLVATLADGWNRVRAWRVGRAGHPERAV